MRSSEADQIDSSGATVYPVLVTERLVLREPRVGDAPGLLAISRDPEVMRYYGMDPFGDLDEARQEIAWMRDLAHKGEGIRWIVANPTSDEYLGDIGFHDHHAYHARAEMGYKLVKRAWRQGLMSEAMEAVLNYGFTALALNRAHALVDPRNVASQSLVARFGFQCEGLLRDYERESGGHVDLEMWSLLRRDWAQRSQGSG